MDEDAVPKTAAPHGVVGSIPTLSAPPMHRRAFGYSVVRWFGRSRFLGTAQLPLRIYTAPSPTPSLIQGRGMENGEAWGAEQARDWIGGHGASGAWRWRAGPRCGLQDDLRETLVPARRLLGPRQDVIHEGSTHRASGYPPRRGVCAARAFRLNLHGHLLSPCLEGRSHQTVYSWRPISPGLPDLSAQMLQKDMASVDLDGPNALRCLASELVSAR